MRHHAIRLFSVPFLVAGLAACQPDAPGGDGVDGGDGVGVGGDDAGVLADGGALDDGGATVDGGAPGLPDLGPPPLGYSDTPPASAAGERCSTEQWWRFGDAESERMHPGGNCIECHTSRGEGPRFTFAGTVMGGLDDETDCRGVPGVTVEIIDANEAVAVTMTTNVAGNFYSEVPLASVALPYTVRLEYEGRERFMGTPQSDGNCMTCHSAAGTGGAPGRILLP